MLQFYKCIYRVYELPDDLTNFSIPESIVHVTRLTTCSITLTVRLVTICEITRKLVNFEMKSVENKNVFQFGLQQAIIHETLWFYHILSTSFDFDLR